MSKRFTDTELWHKSWFMKLTPLEKCGVFYIKDECDNVGVWSPNFQLAEFVIQSKIDWQSLPEKTNGNIMVLENGKWWLPDFCDFQYGELSEESKPHRSYIKQLKKHGLWEGYPYPLDTLKEKEKELEKDKEKDISSKKKNSSSSEKDTADYSADFERFWKEYPRKIEKKTAFKAWKSKIKNKGDPRELIEAAKNYARYCEKNKTEPRYIKHPATFLGPNDPWKDFDSRAPPDEKSDWNIPDHMDPEKNPNWLGEEETADGD